KPHRHTKTLQIKLRKRPKKVNCILLSNNLIILETFQFKLLTHSAFSFVGKSKKHERDEEANEVKPLSHSEIDQQQRIDEQQQQQIQIIATDKDDAMT